MGAMHGVDLIDIYADTDLTDYFIHFVNHLDPNGASVPAWPRFTLDSKKLLTFLDGNTPIIVGKDEYRTEGMNLLTELLLDTPL